ncbi:MAG: hypothetical protein GTN73_07500 [Candidatus Aminicenantes bacterium]|nr:hypothetical protein [Candidatus Aminicenantes bacterium]
MKKFYLLLLTIVFLSLLSCSQASASDTHGNVTLENGSVLPDVLITLKCNNIWEKTIKSSPKGYFRFVKLNPGNYELKFELNGLKTVFRKGIRLFEGKNKKIDVQMKPSSLTEGSPDGHKIMFGSYFLSTEKTKLVAAGKRYRAGGLHRLLLGNDYRRLWTEPIEVEVLNLNIEGGGLTPVKTVGGHQTRGLALKGTDGRAYTFRELDKDPTAVIPPFLVGTIADRIVQDQVSSAHPAGALIAQPLMEAAGVLNTEVRLVVMPDDPSLGKFRSEFAGVLGTIQEYPTPISEDYSGFAAATEIIYFQEMWRRLQTSPSERVDSRAFLRARLVDLFIGDWDRHREQWRWARIPGKHVWQPIPEDRDQAFTRYDGLIPSIARYGLPFILNFGNKYSGIGGMTFAGWDVDRYLLTDLEKPDWEAIASDLKARLTNSVIKTAVNRLPSEYYRFDGARLESALKNRRDLLKEVADRYYRHLARKVDIYMTNKAELAEIIRINDNATEIRVSLKPAREEQTRPEPYYRRRFQHNETREIRLHLLAGDDTVISRGGQHKDITIRIIGVPGHFTVDDSKGGGLKIYNPIGTLKLIPGPGTRLDKREYIPPLVNPNAPWIPPRDWGRHTIPLISFGGSSDFGIFLGGGFTTTAYGFRKHPFSSRQSVRAGYATGAKTFRADYQGMFRPENSRVLINLSARASGIEIFRFYGFGNETSLEANDDFYKVKQEQYSINPSLKISLLGPLSITIGSIMKYSITKLEQDRLISIIRPYGSENFGQLGVHVDFRLDMRNRSRAASRGFLINLGGRYFPGVWDVNRGAFGEVHGDASTFLTASSVPLEPTLALRIGGKHVFGTYPFHEAAFIGSGSLAGSGSSVRGFRAQRFAGDSALYANAELRLRLSDIYLFLPGEMGIFGLGDIGRVYLDGERSKIWHAAFGGGIWISFLKREYCLSIAVARSDERTGIYVSAGFGF